MEQKDIYDHMSFIFSYCRCNDISIFDGLTMFQRIIAGICLEQHIPRDDVKKILASILRTYDENIQDWED